MPRIGKRKYMEQKTRDGLYVFRTWWGCSECEGQVNRADQYCRWCGVRFVGNA